MASFLSPQDVEALGDSVEGLTTSSGEEILQKQALEKTGFFSHRAEDRERIYNQFQLLTGSLDGKLTEDQFFSYATLFWGLTPSLARSCFVAGDLDGSGFMNRDEFLFMSAAIESFDANRDSTQEYIREVRLRTIFTAFDVDNDYLLSFQERFALLRDMSAGDHALSTLLSKFDFLPGPDQFMDYESFKSQIGRLEASGMSTADLLLGRKSDGDARLRVVLDERATAASAQGRMAQSGKHTPAAMSKSNAVYVNQLMTRMLSHATQQPDTINTDLSLDPLLVSHGDWRGPLAVVRGTDAFYIASHVVDSSFHLAHRVLTEEDISDTDWLPEHGQAMFEILDTRNQEHQAARVCMLADTCKEIMKRQPTLVRAQAPAKVFGDIHGQLRDLLLLFGQFGTPTHRGGDIETTQYVFNGDWIDRGAHQVEVVTVLFAAKVMYPTRVHLIRGNHEFRGMSDKMGNSSFREACRKLFPDHWEIVYRKVFEAFEWFPIAALVNSKVLVIHGGIGDGSWSLNELRNDVPRPLLRADERLHILQALWSDPSDSDAEMMRGVHHSPSRGEGIPVFGPDVTAKFCKDNNIDVVVRSHQFVRHGYKIMHGGHLITLFSARNYFSRENNDGALLVIAMDDNGDLRIRPKRFRKR
jgi:diadenosine tetraphosphatase ApaH/serine/threonine PP2A family protein phosphatase/Ca2+-binding EF-hand superfamily protein